MSKETISQAEGLCKEVATCVRNAYDRGYKQGYKDGYEEGHHYGEIDGVMNVQIDEVSYQRGLNDAWECARKIWSMSAYERAEIFHDKNCMLEHTASEAIQMIKEYEEKGKTDDEIKVGDEVDHDGLKCVVVKVWQDCICTISQVGTTPSYTDKSVLKKTGRHFDQIEKLFKQLQEK